MVFLYKIICLLLIKFLLIADQPEITAQLQNVTTIEGYILTLSCNATGNPVPTISWTKDGSAISSDSRISLSADNKHLTIMNVNRTDSGEYRCVASNSLGNDTSSDATLNIQCKSTVCWREMEILGLIFFILFKKERF